MSILLYDLVQLAKDNFSRELDYGKYESQDSVDELIYDIADQRVPDNTQKILDLAQREWELLETEPETASY